MIQLSFMDKAQKDKWLPLLFDLYYSNMSKIAPSGLSYQEERAEWFCAVSSALDKELRKVILCTERDEIIGYVQYYTRDDLLMIEEIQIAKKYHRTLLFYRICKYLVTNLPSEIRYIEAYADKRNANSQSIMRKLRMIQKDSDSKFVHLRGDAESVRKHLR